MGQTQSINLPSGKNFHFSYSKKTYNFNEKCKIKESTDLTHLITTKIPEFSSSFIYYCLWYKIKGCGYSIKEINNIYKIPGCPLNEIIKEVISDGISSSDKKDSLKDLSIKQKSYKVDIDNIKKLISTGNILLAGIVIDNDFSVNTLGINIEKTVTDIILIVGYTKSTINILTNWKDSVIEISNEYIDNFIEIWNFDIESPDNLFLDKKLN